MKSKFAFLRCLGTTGLLFHKHLKVNGGFKREREERIFVYRVESFKESIENNRSLDMIAEEKLDSGLRMNVEDIEEAHEEGTTRNLLRNLERTLRKIIQDPLYVEYLGIQRLPVETDEH